MCQAARRSAAAPNGAAAVTPAESRAMATAIDDTCAWCANPVVEYVLVSEATYAFKTVEKYGERRAPRICFKSERRSPACPDHAARLGLEHDGLEARRRQRAHFTRGRKYFGCRLLPPFFRDSCPSGGELDLVL